MDYITHGSEDSLDHDIHYLSPVPLLKAEAKRIADGSPDGNANVICVKDGIVIWSYKGSPDETNNGILATYDLHDQFVKNPVVRRVDREIAVKVVRTIRGVLGVNSRGPMRLHVKQAIRSNSMAEKLDVLSRISLTGDFGDRDRKDSFKFIAFQIAQCYALVAKKQELFTKSQCSKEFHSLRPFLDRKDGDLRSLQIVWDSFIHLIKNSYVQDGDFITVDNTTAHIMTELPLR